MTDAADKPMAPFTLGRMNSPRAYRRALHRLANSVLDGSVPPRTAGTVGYLLGMCIKALEIEVTVDRITALEKQLGIADRPKLRLIGGSNA